MAYQFTSYNESSVKVIRRTDKEQIKIAHDIFFLQGFNCSAVSHCTSGRIVKGKLTH